MDAYLTVVVLPFLLSAAQLVLSHGVSVSVVVLDTIEQGNTGSGVTLICGQPSLHCDGLKQTPPPTECNLILSDLASSSQCPTDRGGHEQ